MTTLIITTIGLINFGYCDYLNGLQFLTNVNYTNNGVYTSTPYELGIRDTGLLCFNVKGYTGGRRFVLSWSVSNNLRYITSNTYISNLFGCIYVDNVNTSFIISSENGGNIESFNVDFYYLNSNYDIVSGNPGYTSLQCQTEYNLMPISDYTSANCMVDFNLLPVSVVNQNYCVSNGLCPSSSGSGNVNTGDIQWSALYINQIQHVSAPIINIDIPEEIERDYESDEEEMNIEIKGYGYDEEKMLNMINTQNYTPTDTEMSELIAKIADFLPLLAVALLIIRARRVLKKVFRF